MQAIILAIGDELVLGQSVDTNSAYLSARLAELGIMTRAHHTVADDRDAIARAIRDACAQAELVLITGGLGPTADDLTRPALADALGVDLELDPQALREIEAFFARRQRPMPPSNRVQAMRPVGTHGIANPHGTAPGIRGTLGNARFYVTPGVPREMKFMFEESIFPELARLATAQKTGVLLTTRLSTFGLGESSVGERLGDLMRRDRNPTVGTTVAGGVVSVRIRAAAPDAAQARAQLEDTCAQVQRLLDPYVYGRDETTLPQTLLAMLRQRQLTLATAESCTGGLLGKCLTDVPGASAVYLGGWITYANDLKIRELGVPAALLQAHGAVSAPVAQAMAQSALIRSRAHLAAAVTGIAGPEGGSPDKPVGTVWVGLAWSRDVKQDAPALGNVPGSPPGSNPRNNPGNNPGSAPASVALRLNLANLDRETLRDRAAKTVFQLLRFHLLGQRYDLIHWVAG